MPIITLSTDIGQQDYIIGAVKGQLLQIANNVQVADITHYLLPYNFTHATYICNNAFKYYPAGTFHIILIDVFSGNKRILVAELNQQFIICPDNGMLTLLAGKVPEKIQFIEFPSNATILSITKKIADSIKTISQNGFTVNALSEKIIERVSLKPTFGDNWMDGQILFIDHFENVIVNITKEEFEAKRQGRRFKILFKRDETIDDIKEHYGSVNESEMVAFFNAAGYLEIALNKGNMAGLFGLQKYNEHAKQQLQNAQQKWFYHTVRIHFE